MFWITNQKGVKYHPWIFFGPAYNTDGIKIWRLMVGPFSLSVGFP